MDNIDISKVINRKGDEVDLDYNKILNRLSNLINMEPKLNISPHRITIKTIEGIYDKIHTYELDELSSKICGSLITTHPDYSQLASRIEISNLHKETNDCFIQTLHNANSYKDSNDRQLLLVNPKLIKFAEYYKDIINNSINYLNDYKFEYFGILTLKKSYLLKHINEKRNIIIERPQHLYMRVALGIHLSYVDNNGKLCDNHSIDEVIDTYNLLSNGYYSHATPTLFNAGTLRSSLSSCFLLNIADDLENIYDILKETAMISKWSGGIGICATDVRSKGALIKGTNGISDGLVPMLKVFNDSACYVNQGGGKRKGSTAVYLEPWHADIHEFLDLKKPIGDEMLRARDLFLALWIPDVFMDRLIESIEQNKTVMWSLMCPNECPLLGKTYGDEFTKHYIEYERNGKYRKQINIQELWRHILEIQQESGMPYIMYKDHVNRKCNQNNQGVIKSSNLCVHGDTLILTKTGYQKIKDLDGKNVEIWNGTKWSLSPVRQTNTSQELYKVITSDGCELKCTKYHKFHIKSKDNNIKELQDLKPGDMLIDYKFPIVDTNNNDFKYPYTHGFYCGNNSTEEYTIMLHHDKLLLRKNLKFMGEITNDTKTKYILDKSIEKRYVVPINFSLNVKLEWLAGLIDAAGFLCKNINSKCLQIKSDNKEFLFNVKLLMNTISCNPRLKKIKDKWVLLFNNNDTNYVFNRLNIKTKKIVNTDNLVNNNKTYVMIQSIEKISDLHDTYCFNEPINNTGIFNGILTGNCAEINIYTDELQTGVCNLASITLPKYIEYKNNEPYFNYDKLYEVVKTVTYNLNKVIDNNYYPTEKGENADSLNRPIGIGVSGLADVFILFKCGYTSDTAKELNRKIFETIYYSSINASVDLAIKYNTTYTNFNTSMLASGILQPDLWNVVPSFDKWDWNTLRNRVKKYGSYNSLNIALMPTASTASILGVSENFEPITSNMYVRRVLSGTFQIVNKYLIKDLIELNIWNDNIKQRIIANDGSIQDISEIPDSIKQVYKTAYEYKLKDLIDMDRDRGAYVCHSCSSNRFVEKASTNKLTSLHIYAYKQGLKTSSYYIRLKTIANAVKFNVDVDIIKEIENKKKIEEEEEVCNICSA